MPHVELPVDGRVKEWGIPQVAQWLEENNMGHYSEDFRDSYIDGEKLLTSVFAPTLRNMQVHPKHIRLILDAIKTYQEYNPDDIYELGDSSSSDAFTDEEGDDDDYVRPDEDEGNVGEPPRLDRMKTRSLPPTPDEDGDSDGSYEQPDESIVPPTSRARARPPAPLPVDDEPPPPPPRPGKSKPARHVSPPVSPDPDRMTSLPMEIAPAPPLPNHSYRPPAPDPVQLMPSSPHIIIAHDPEENYIDPDPVHDPVFEQEEYEEVGGPEPVVQHTRPNNVKPLPTLPLGNRAGRGKAPYPLVILPGGSNQINNNNSLPETPPRPDQGHTARDKKIMPYRYTDNEIKPHPAKVAPLSKTPQKPLPAPPTSRTLPTGTTPPEKTTEVDTTGMSIKERMAFLSMQSGGVPPPGSRPPVPANKPSMPQNTKPRPTGGDSLLKAMQQKQKERKINHSPNAANVNGHALPGTPNTPPKPQGPPQLPTTRHPKIPKLPTPPGRNPDNQAAAADTPPPLPPMTGRRASIDSTASSEEDPTDMYNYTWYASNIDRTRSLLMMKKHDGAFIVRKSRKDPAKPYTLDAMYQGQPYHIPIRQRPDGKFSIGAAKRNEASWDSVAEMIRHFQHNNLSLNKAGSPTYYTTLRE